MEKLQNVGTKSEIVPNIYRYFDLGSDHFIFNSLHTISYLII